MLRLFVAIDLPADVKDALAELGAGVPGARWVLEEQLHLTLRFIGEVDETTAARVEEALGLVGGPPFGMAVKGCGHYPPRGRPRVLWAGLEADEELTRLRGRVESACRRLGLPPERRRWSPHVTLARLTDAPSEAVARFLGENAALATERFEVKTFLLFSSVLGKQGATYRVRAAYPLRR